MGEKRKYELKKRAERLAETRRRITEATVELHRTVGPAATQINEVARRAGVQRMTVYNHFPDEPALLTACSAHWRALHPSPDLAAWRAVEDPGARLRLGLRELYALVPRDRADDGQRPARRPDPSRPARRSSKVACCRYLDQARQVLTEPIDARGRRRQRVDAAARAAVDLHTWRALAPLGDTEAAELAAGLVELAAGTS